MSNFKYVKALKVDYIKKRRVVSVCILVVSFALFSGVFYATFGTANLEQASMSEILRLAGRFFGLAGFLCIAFLIISGDLARFFDRFFGIDRIIKFQRKFAILTYFIVFSHPFLFMIARGRFLSSLLPDFTYLPASAGIIGLYIFIGVMISSLNYKKIPHSVWQYIHIITYVLFFLIFYHAVNMGTAYAENAFIRAVYWGLFTVVIFGLIYRAIYKFKQRKYEFRVRDIRWETHDTFTLVLKSSGRPDFVPGQFFFLRILKNKLFARHPFSVSDSPSNKDLAFTMKIEGRFTKTAAELYKGEEVKLEGPFGNFKLNDEKKDAVFLAGGVGITPFMSMLKAKTEKGSEHGIILLYGSKTRKDIIFKEQLDAINEKWFKKVYVLSKEKYAGLEFEAGYINADIIKKHVEDIHNKHFYICGPEDMKNACLQILKELRIKKRDIFLEDFFW